MKTRIIINLVVLAVASAAITFGQWAVVMGGDDFVVTDFGKAFIYGFPFRIVNAALDSPLRTPHWQIPLRLIGNFLVFFIVGLLLVQVAKRVREIQKNEDEASNRTA